MQPGSSRERRTCSRLNLLTSLKESSRAVTLPVTTIIAFPRRFGSRSPSCDRIAGAGKFDRLLRPAFERRATGIGQDIDAALGAIEPAIDIMQQNLRCIGDSGLEIAHPPRSA